MEKKKNQITVKLNNEVENDRSFHQYHEEAAGVDEIPEHAYKQGRDHKKKKGDRNKYARKKKIATQGFIITGLSAIVIGVLLGLILLKMFVPSGEEPIIVQPVNTDTEIVNPPTTDGGQSELELPSLQAHVIQAGVFSSVEQGEAWQATVNQSGYQSMLWHADEDIRLFTGVYPSEAEAKRVAEIMGEVNLDLYVREWSSPARTIEMEEPLIEWLIAFADSWRDTTTLGMTDQIKQDWSMWLESAPSNIPASVTHLQTRIEAYLEQPNQATIELELLSWWYLYNQI